LKGILVGPLVGFEEAIRKWIEAYRAAKKQVPLSSEVVKALLDKIDLLAENMDYERLFIATKLTQTVLKIAYSKVLYIT